MFAARKNRDLIVLFDYLSQSDQAGVPLVEAMSQSAQLVDDRSLRNAIYDITSHLRKGSPVSEAFERYPKIFSPPVRALILAGQETGGLGRAFARCRQYMKWREEYRLQIVKMLRYPLIVTALLAVLATVSGGQSSFFSFLLLLAFFWGALKLRGVWPDFKDFTDRLLLKIPAFGAWLKQLHLARFSGIFSILYKAGLKPDHIMKISVSATDNAEIQRVLEDVRYFLDQGDSLYDSFSKTGFFPPSFMRSIKAGEQSGRIDLALEEQSVSFDQDVTRSLDLLLKTLPPVVVIVLGILFLMALG